MRIIPHFTDEQQQHICEIIGKWYVEWEPKLVNWEEKTHKLGYAKEKLKYMICGEKDE